MCLLFCVNSVFGQSEQSVNPQNSEQPVKVLDTVKWKQLNKVGLDINEVTFVNWNAGGANSISALLAIKSSLRYKKNSILSESN